MGARRSQPDVTNSANAAETKLRNELRLSLLKMPKKIRTMPLHEFTTAFNEDVKAVLLSDVDSRHDRLLLLLDAEENTAMQPPGTKAKKTARKPAKRADMSARGAEAGASDAAAPMTVTRTTRKRKAAASGTEGAEEGEAPTTLRRSVRTRSRTTSAGDMTTPMPTRGGVGRTPFGNGGNAKAALTPGIVPGSASRMPKMGEVFFSKNGAPIAVDDAAQCTC